MTTFELDLSRMTAYQIAALDVVLNNTHQVSSKVRIEVMRAGDANCGQAEYDRLYNKISKAIEAATTEATK